MKRFVNSLAAAAALTLVASGGTARAAQTFGVEVWIGKLPSTQADAANVPTSDVGLTHATFDYTGSVNWSSINANNYFQDFIPLANITNYAGNVSLATLGTSGLSVSGDAYSAFFQITGVYSAASDYSGSVTHDDGASLYTDVGTAFEHPAETAALTNSFTLPSGVHSFTLDYVEGNGAPSVLQINFPNDVATTTTTAAPEPMSMVLLGGALAGLAAVRRRR